MNQDKFESVMQDQPGVAKMVELKAELVALRKDAELYRALRSMHWHSSPLAVVRNPKEAVKPGHDCPSGDRLDEAILEAIAGGADFVR